MASCCPIRLSTAVLYSQHVFSSSSNTRSRGWFFSRYVICRLTSLSPNDCFSCNPRSSFIYLSRIASMSSNRRGVRPFLRALPYRDCSCNPHTYAWEIHVEHTCDLFHTGPGIENVDCGIEGPPGIPEYITNVIIYGTIFSLPMRRYLAKNQY